MRIRPVGAHALLLDCTIPAAALAAAGDTAVSAAAEIAAADASAVPVASEVAGAEVAAWRDELWRRREAGELTADEIVPAATTVLLDGVPDPVATAVMIAGWRPRPVTAATGPEIRIPTVYDGVDLPTVAAHWRVDVTEVVHRLSRARFRVAFCGFAPGFGYLTGLPAEWSVPRLDSPRPRVPAGSIALAGPYAGIYPTASPGGWLLVGRTGLSLFDVRHDPPARLVPGTRVRLVPA